MNKQGTRIYLDNAATSYPKPEVVYEAVDHYQRNLGGAVGRGATQVGLQIQQTVDRCRQRVAQFLGVAAPSQVVFTLNGTDSLNLALHGLLQPGDEVVTTCWEHNSVLRPLETLSRSKQIRTSYLGPTADGTIDLDELRSRLNPQTRLICVTHASNVTGIVQPIAEVVEIARQHGTLVLLDAAQTAGHLPLSMQSLDVDLLACPGHKGLLGPLGTGILAIKPGLEEQLMPLRQGGTGSQSEEEAQPTGLPDKYESGNHNASGLFGLEAALTWLAQNDLHEIHSRLHAWTQRFIEGVQAIPGITVCVGASAVLRVPVVSLTATAIAPHVLAGLLDEHFSIETRAGFHCSPRAHRALGTFEQGGTVRFSLGPLTTADDIDATLEAIAQIAAAF